MYTFDLFRDDRFMVCLGHYSDRNHAEMAALHSFGCHADKPENAGVRWQVRQAVYDSDGELDHCVLVKEWIAA